MKILRSQKEIEATTANPAEGVLGFDINAELDKAMNTALKPIAAKLREYKAEENRLIAICQRWTPDALAEKLHDIASRAQAGDEEAAQAISDGAIPTKAAYADMCRRAETNLEHFRFNGRRIFLEAAALIPEPMHKVVERGQKIVDQTCESFGIPRYELTGYTNHINWTCEQLRNAGNNLSASLDGFWQRFK